MSDEMKAILAAFGVGLIIGAIIGVNAGLDIGWSRTYIAVKSGTIEQEMQKRAPALWIELNAKKTEK